MAALTSPVYAPCGAACRFCPATPTRLPSSAAATAWSAVNGGATTISASRTVSMRARKAAAYAVASATVLCIFQLAAMKGVLMAHSAGGCPGSASGRALTPGSVRPARNSSDAPPPVEMCVMRSRTPALPTAATESPPPTTVVAAASATARATASVPAAKASISNTPMGPFQTTVPARPTTSAYAARVRGPMSTPIRVRDGGVIHVERRGGRPRFDPLRDDMVHGQPQVHPRAARVPLHCGGSVEQVRLDQRLADRQAPGA